MHPGPVIGAGFARDQQGAVAGFGGIHAEDAAIAEAAGGELRDRLRHAVDQSDMQIAGGGEVAFIGEVGSFADIERIDRLRHQPVQIGIALAMRVGAHVDRHVVDIDREIGAVVEIIAAQKILVGFAVAGMLGDDQAGHGFQHFARPRHRPRVELFAGRGGLARHGGRRGGPEPTFGAPEPRL